MGFILIQTNINCLNHESKYKVAMLYDEVHRLGNFFPKETLILKKVIDCQNGTPSVLGNTALRQNDTSSAGNARLQPSGSTLLLYTFIIINYSRIQETIC